MAYNPYKDIKTITELKGKYHTAKEKGQDPSQYQNEAAQYYVNLRSNGYTDVANDLTMADYTKSLDILKAYPEPMEYDYLFEDYKKQAEKAYEPVRSETVDQIMSVYETNNNNLNGPITKDSNGNVVTGLNLDHYNTGRNQLDYINNFDVTSQPYYQGIMQQYNLLGSDAANGQLASGASTNSGNIDSYAQANANRQQLAFTTAGQQAALDAAAQNMTFWQNLYDSMTGHLGTMGDQANQQFAIGADIYAADSAERQNALNQAAALQDRALQNQINEFIARLEGDTARYTTDKTADTTLEQQRIQNELDRFVAQLEGDTAMAQLYAAQTGGTADTGSAELDEELTLDEAFGAILEDMENGNTSFTNWGQIRDYLVQNGYNLKKVNENIDIAQKTYGNLLFLRSDVQ